MAMFLTPVSHVLNLFKSDLYRSLGSMLTFSENLLTINNWLWPCFSHLFHMYLYRSLQQQAKYIDELPTAVILFKEILVKVFRTSYAL